MIVRDVENEITLAELDGTFSFSWSSDGKYVYSTTAEQREDGSTKTVWFDGNVKQVNRKQFIPGQDMQCFYSWKQRRVVGYLFMFVRIIITQNWFFRS